MSQETLYRLCQQFHISSDYILFGITLEDAAKKPDTIIDIANHLSAEELTQVIEYLNSLKMMKLSEFVNKKLHAIFHRASKQFKVDARDLACGYGSNFSSPVPSFQRHRGYGSAFPSPVPSSWSSPHPHKQFDPPITGRVILHLYFFLVDRAAASGAASVVATASTAALPPSQLAELTPHDKEDGDRDNRNNNDICHICLLSLPM